MEPDDFEDSEKQTPRPGDLRLAIPGRMVLPMESADGEQPKGLEEDTAPEPKQLLPRLVRWQILPRIVAGMVAEHPMRR